MQRNVPPPIVEPENLSRLEQPIRDRVGEILNLLPHNETFDWADKALIELAPQPTLNK